MARHRGRAALPIVLAVAALLLASGTPGGASTDAPEASTHRLREVAPGVFFATEAESSPVMSMSNSLVIVGAREALVVDSHASPAAAAALQRSVASLTDAPVRTLVNTHFHFDHTHGNEVFGPTARIVSHAFTRTVLAGEPRKTRTAVRFRKLLTGQLRNLEARREAAGADPELEREILRVSDHLRSARTASPTPPDTTFERGLTLWRAGREVQLHFLGRGHTSGDVVVLLPAERIVYTGDLLLPMLPYLGDAHVDEWADTLERLEELDFDLVLPGHGEPFRDRRRIARMQDLLRDLWRQVVRLRDEGLSVSEAARSVDLTAYADSFRIPGPGIPGPAVERIYELLAGRER